jgi:hypothetical protein
MNFSALKKQHPGLVGQDLVRRNGSKIYWRSLPNKDNNSTQLNQAYLLNLGGFTEQFGGNTEEFRYQISEF